MCLCVELPSVVGVVDCVGGLPLFSASKVSFFPALLRSFLASPTSRSELPFLARPPHGIPQRLRHKKKPHNFSFSPVFLTSLSIFRASACARVMARFRRGAAPLTHFGDQYTFPPHSTSYAGAGGGYARAGRDLSSSSFPPLPSNSESRSQEDRHHSHASLSRSAACAFS
jgi:hypothetical protein